MALVVFILVVKDFEVDAQEALLSESTVSQRLAKKRERLYLEKMKLENETLVTGLQLTPNPFSPNGDGIHDFLNISYVIPDEIDQAVVEIYDMRGERVRILQLFTGVGDMTNRTDGLVWDGKDESGNYVPFGIYVCRVEVLGKFLNRWERATAAVVVVR